MSIQTLALQNYVSRDGLVFPKGHIVHRNVLKLVHAAWQEHLKKHGNADAKIIQLFQAMHDNMQKYVHDMEGFWETVKKEVPWTRCLFSLDVSDIAENFVKARRNYREKLKGRGRVVMPSEKPLLKLVDSWIQWHDRLRRGSRSVPIILSFPPPVTPWNFFWTSSSSAVQESSDRTRKVAMTDDVSQAGGTMPSSTNLDANNNNNGPANSSFPVGSSSHNPMGETADPLPSSMRISNLVNMTPDSILQSANSPTDSPTDPRTYQYNQSQGLLSQALLQAQSASASTGYQSASSNTAQTLGSLSMPAVSPFHVQNAASGTHVTNGMTHDAAMSLAASLSEAEAADIPIPSIEEDGPSMSSATLKAANEDGFTSDSLSEEISEESD